jgi:hypothetical protein
LNRPRPSVAHRLSSRSRTDDKAQSDRVLGSLIRAADGDAGTVSDLLSDDQSIAIRWIVVRVGSWLNEEHVLASPRNFVRSQTDPRILETGSAIEDLTEARPLEDALPVSLRRLREAIIGSGLSPFRIAPSGRPPVVRLQSSPPGDRNLRSISHVTDYEDLADGGTVGRVANFIIVFPE